MMDKETFSSLQNSAVLLHLTNKNFHKERKLGIVSHKRPSREATSDPLWQKSRVEEKYCNHEDLNKSSPFPLSKKMTVKLMLFEFKGKQKRFYNFKEKWTHQWWEDMLLWSYHKANEA